MKIINLKNCELELNEKATRIEYKNKRKEIGCYEISTINHLEEFIKSPPFPLGRQINDFIKFHPKEYSYLQSLIDSDMKFNKQMINEQIFSKIFKYRFKTMLEYWICRGWSIDDAKLQVSKLQSTLSKKSIITKRKNPDYKSTFNTTIEYWLKKGLSKEDAIKNLKERQTTFTLEKCIKKYGKEKGMKIYNDRQLKWIESLYNGKSQEQIKKMYEDRVKDGVFGASKASLKVFLPIINKLKEDRILNAGEYYIGYDSNKEFMLYDPELKIVYFYDFVIPKFNLIIEFNGTLWHPKDSNWEPAKFVKQTKEEILLKESRKEIIAKQNGFKILKIWDTDSQSDNYNKCLDYIMSNITDQIPPR